MAPELIFKPPKAAWIDPPPTPQNIPDNARIALVADWGTQLYGAPAITKCIEGLDRCDVVLHRCIGNGGFPGFRDDLPGAHGNVYQWINLAAQPQAPKARLLDGPNFWIPQEPEGFVPHGYVVLDFDGDTVSETYRVPNNVGLLKAHLGA